MADAVEASGGEVTMTYEKAIDGLAVSMTPAKAFALRARSDVVAVEPDLPVTIGVVPMANDDAGGGAVITDPGCTANSMPAGDDPGSEPITLSGVTTVNWFGAAYSQILINNNGGFSFNDGNGAFTSYNGVNLNTTTRPLVLPVFTDIDTRNSATTVVQWGPLSTTFGGRAGYCINWVNVGRYNASAPVYSAQVLIINRDDRRTGDVDIVFNYDRIASSTSSNALEVGFANPTDRTKSVRFSGSGSTPNLLVDGAASALISNSRNPSGSPFTSKNGRFVYQVANSASPSASPTPTPGPTCGTSVPVGTQGCATWGLDRIDQFDLPLDERFTPAGTGSGVTAYIVDTGIYAAQTEFTGRIATGWNTTTTPANTTTTDCHGHGTHVAGTVAGTIYGVAKSATLVPVKVLDCTGSGTTSGVIAGLEWIVTNHATGVPAVANMSLGGGKSAALNTAVANVVADGVTVAVAAGNETQDACNVSPASEPTAITVGATTSADALAYYSNFGTCVDILAPGSSITSAGISSSTAIATMSGTSMASPGVAGAAAVYMGLNPSATPAQVVAALTAAATADRITGVSGSPNKLLYAKSFSTSSAPPAGGGSSGGGSSGGGSSGGGSSGGGSSGGGGTSGGGESSGGGSSGGGGTTAPIVTPVAAPVAAPVVAPITLPATAPVVIPNPQRVTGGQVDSFTPGQVGAIPGAILAQLPPTAIASLSPEQAAALTVAQVSFLRPNQAAALQPDSVAALSPEQMAGFRPAAVSRLSPQVVAELSAEQLAGLRPSAFARLTPAQTAQLSPEQITNITPARIAGIRPTALAKLPPSTLARMSPTQLRGLTPSQIRVLTPAQLAALTPAQRRLLT